MRRSISLVVLGLSCTLSLAARAQPEPQPVDPQPVDPKPAEPEPGDPKPADAPPPEPQPAPQPVDPRPADAPPPEPQPAPQPAPAAAATFPSPEIAALFPAGVLAELPAAMAPFIRLEDYRKLHDACPQPDAAAALACFDAEPAASQVAHAYLRGVVASILDQMDVALAPRLAPAELDGLSDRCKEAIAPWAGCTLEKGLTDPSCSEPEDVLARCVTDDDGVNVAYLALQDEKKAAWGDATQYVKLRGLFALFAVAQIADVRKACPQTDDTVRACLEKDALAGPALQAFVSIAGAIATESAGELAKAGVALSEGQAQELTQRVLTLFLTFPMRAVASVASDCEKQHPELVDISDPKEIDQMLTCIEGGADADPVANPAFISKEKLRGWLAKGRAKVESVVRAKEATAQGRSFRIVAIVIGIAAGVGALVVLCLPFWIRRKYPNAKGLWPASLGAAGVFVMTMAMLGGTLLVIRTVQGAVGTDSTSPKMRLVDAAFSVLEREDYVQTFSDLSKLRLDFIKTPLRQLSADIQAAGEAVVAAGLPEEAKGDAVAAVIATHWAHLLEQPELQRVAKNFGMLKEHVGTYMGAVKMVKSLDSILGYVPILLAILTVIMYLLPMRRRLIDIAMGPARAAATGGSGVGVKTAMRSIVGELKIVGPYILLVLVLLPLVGFFIAFAVEPLMQMVINVALLNIGYVLGADASGFAIQASFIGTLVLLVATLVVYILTLSSYMGTFRKILSARFHDGETLATFKPFWVRGTLALIALLAFPALFAQLARFVQMSTLEGVGDELAGTDLWVVPVASVGVFIVVFWAARGLKAIGQLKFKKARLATT